MQEIIVQYEAVEQTIREALNALNEVCDGAKSQDQQGFKQCHVNEFTQSLIAQERPFSARQLEAAYKIVKQYPTQLQKNGISLPDFFTVRAEANKRELAKIKKDLERTEGSGMMVQYHHEKFWITFPGYDAKIFKAFKEKCLELWRRNYPGFAIKPKWSEDENLGWELPRSYQMLSLFIKMFPKASFSEDELTQKAMSIIKREAQEAKIKVTREEARRVAEMTSLLSQVNLEGEVTDGVKLYRHQIECAKFAAYKGDVIIADKMGLGKTVEAAVMAMMYAKKYGLKIIVITKKNIRKVWLDWAERLQLKMEVYTWQKIPELADDCAEYMAICDESHLSQNMAAQRTQKMLRFTLHPQCKRVIHCTGTPTPNGRPRELYAMLLSCKHPLVWSDNPNPEEQKKEIKELKHKYELNYCSGKWDEQRGHRFWDDSGAAHLEELHNLLYYKPASSANHMWACIIRREKKECLDLPEKERIMYEAEVSDESKALLAQILSEAIDQFENNKEQSLAQYRIDRAQELQKNEQLLIEAGKEINEKWQITLEKECKNKETDIENARTLALQTAYRRASALAKVDTTVDLAKDLLAQGEKVVIFTMFRESAEQIKRRLEEEAQVAVGTVLGGQKEIVTASMIEDFQNPNGKRKVMVCSSAGGEGITLTAASYLILNDRAWRPGDNEQYEDRIHRIGTKSTCFIYWPQLPTSVCETDVWIDGILLNKDKSINLISKGSATNSLTFRQECIAKIKKDAKKNAKAAKQAA